MGFDPELAASNIPALAAITDAELTADTRARIQTVLTAWSAWRSSVTYPRPGHHQYQINDDRDRLVAEVTATLEQLPPAVDLTGMVDLAHRLIQPAWGPPGDHGVEHAVSELRHTAVNRTSLVREARSISRASGVQPDP